MSLLHQHVSVASKEAAVRRKARRFVDGCPRVRLQQAAFVRVFVGVLAGLLTVALQQNVCPFLSPLM